MVRIGDVSHVTEEKEDPYVEDCHGQNATSKLAGAILSSPLHGEAQVSQCEDNGRSDEMFHHLSTSGEMRKMKSHAQLSSKAHGVRMLAKNISKAKMSIQVENLMIVTKMQDKSLAYLTREMVEWILTQFSTINVYVDANLKCSKRFNEDALIKDSNCPKNRLNYWTKEFIVENGDIFDLVIALGGDGTVLHVSSMFQKEVPPVMSFALGSLGFMTIFKYENFREDLTNVLHSQIRTEMRMRLCCRIYRRKCKVPKANGGNSFVTYEAGGMYHVLNELAIDRGSSPFISMLELYGDDSLLTVAQADGLIIATPTGSTAYSLSAGGSLVYPTVNAISVTPICPHTLSFRPIILPDGMSLKVKVPLRSRGTAWAAFDGKNRVELLKGDYVTVTASPYAFPTLEASPLDFIHSIRRTLNWNSREPQRSFTHMLSQKNQVKYRKDLDDIMTGTSSDSVDGLLSSGPEHNDNSGNEELELLYYDDLSLDDAITYQSS